MTSLQRLLSASVGLLGQIQYLANTHTQIWAVVPLHFARVTPGDRRHLANADRIAYSLYLVVTTDDALNGSGYAATTVSMWRLRQQWRRPMGWVSHPVTHVTCWVTNSRIHVRFPALGCEMNAKWVAVPYFVCQRNKRTGALCSAWWHTYVCVYVCPSVCHSCCMSVCFGRQWQC